MEVVGKKVEMVEKKLEVVGLEKEVEMVGVVGHYRSSRRAIASKAKDTKQSETRRIQRGSILVFDRIKSTKSKEANQIRIHYGWEVFSAYLTDSECRSGVNKCSRGG
uniref:Uncharacterized protein n=1 Tax=Brassica oleracea var. oleracea TaxID=109376 RepID=A0A0D3B997_BRAOL